MKASSERCRKSRRTLAGGRGRWRPLWRDERGTQLLEFALMLPMLLVLAVGTIDFAGAYVLKQKLTNAAREGARIMVEQPWSDITQTNPNTVRVACDAIVNYMDNANIDVTGPCPNPTKNGATEWTYSVGDATIIIDRGVAIPVAGPVSLGTRVTVRYPFTWTFAQVIQIMIQPPPSYSNTITITGTVVMKNLTP